jgi:hypothetical protein
MGSHQSRSGLDDEHAKSESRSFTPLKKAAPFRMTALVEKGFLARFRT